MSNATAPAPNRPDTDDPLVYAVTLAPHRSLSPTGFRVVMGAMALVSFGAGTLFLTLGAWPVFGFFGLDVLLLYLAFRASYAGARAREHITITTTLIEVRHAPARGPTRTERLNPFWTRLFRRDDEDFGTQEVALVSGARHIAVGSFLGPEEKGRLAEELGAAIGVVRRGHSRG
ncbi:DUF2244 domain-containing protein [Xanthobacter agilis]|uniref:Membrane protein n=1 Tax=Xanthobacter agilis TaxID=47492 RepID=A0ABU0LD37_XANAG|nr:DUF2244 domain-containing protein [Xanthobacter agilis]MDQ0505053.1 putative membrane protein [Xanthobacter agilis]